MPDFSGFAGHVKDVQEANAAAKEGVVASAVKALREAQADLEIHLEHPRTLAKLRGIAPPMQVAVVAIVSAVFHTTGDRLIVFSGVRSDKEQQELYAQGRDPKKPGKIVTHLDGIRRRSNHQVAVEGPWRGLGCAVDLVFLDGKGAPSWAEVHPWPLLGTLGKSHGLVWGGDWPTIRDRPHLEMMQ